MLIYLVYFYFVTETSSEPSDVIQRISGALRLSAVFISRVSRLHQNQFGSISTRSRRVSLQYIINHLFNYVHASDHVTTYLRNCRRLASYCHKLNWLLMKFCRGPSEQHTYISAFDSWRSSIYRNLSRNNAPCIPSWSRVTLWRRQRDCHTWTDATLCHIASESVSRKSWYLRSAIADVLWQYAYEQCRVTARD